MEYQEINCNQLQDLLASGDIIVLDIRSDDSYAAGHLPGATHLKVSALDEFCKRPDRNEQKVLVYCYHGISSQSAARFLQDAGFGKVYSLIGGYEGWLAQHSRSEATSG